MQMAKQKEEKGMKRLVAQHLIQELTESCCRFGMSKSEYLCTHMYQQAQFPRLKMHNVNIVSQNGPLLKCQQCKSTQILLRT